MKYMLSAALLAGSAVGFAAVPIDGWYVGAFGGYSYVPNNLNVVAQNKRFNSDSLNSGYHAGGRLGYKNNPMRYEAELTYLDANVKEFYINNVRQGGVSGYQNAWALMGNVYYDLPEIVPAVQPYLGAGLGFAWVNSHFKSQAPMGNQRYDGSKTAFAYQATTGLTFNFAENYALDIAYRYLATDRIGYLGKVYQANLATVAVTYRFDGNNYK